MSYDVAALREEFPSLRSGIAHFDSPGGTQTPRVVGEAIAATLTGPLSNRGTSTASERNAEQSVADFRQAYADLLGGDPSGIVFGRSATQLTFDLARTLSASWGPGDEVVVSRLDHDANVRPWVIAAKRAGASVRWIDLDPETAELGPVPVSERTRLVAVTGASNLLGTRPPVARIAAQAHRAGALLYVDGVHHAAHGPAGELGADFYVCSPYKFLGPHCAVLAADPDVLEGLSPDKLLPSTDVVPERFELGTLPYETLAGATAAVDFLAGLGTGASRRERLLDAWERIDAHEVRLRQWIEEVATALPGVVLHSRAADRTPTLLFSFEDRDCQGAAGYLAERGVAAPAGSFYAWEPIRRLGLEAGLRVGLAPYTDDSDVDRLLAGLRGFTGRRFG
ncbi:MAG TPA: cysteine desulfurase-like protein [Propionicimonas sp.]|jgi:cysteine desulfurase family protein (TIGR01976 family)|nr:cysteine desulfurase-like protein [Propionicimonas sp.]